MLSIEARICRRMGFYGPLLMLAALSSCSEGDSESEAAVPIDGEPTCEECRLQLQKVAVLGVESDSSSISVSSEVARDSRGRYFVAPTYNPGEIDVFDSAGTYSRSLGAEGEGPGEFQEIFAVQAEPGDSLYVMNMWNLDLLDPDGDFVRRVSLAGRPTEILFQQDGDLVAYLEADEPPLRILKRDGSVQASFGGIPGTGGRLPILRRIALGREGSVWSGHRPQYRIDHFSEEGEYLATYTRDLEWFESRWNEEEERQQGSFYDLQIGSDGILRVLLSRERPDWQPPGRIPEGAERPARSLSVPDILDRIDLYLEYIDPAEGRLVLSQQLPDSLWIKGFVSPDHVYSIREEENGGRMVMEIWRVRLHR